MSESKTSFQVFLEDEINRYKGVYVPVKTAFLKRAFVRVTPMRKLHPNPEDEFCDPKIGPNYEINFTLPARDLGGKEAKADQRSRRGPDR